MCVLIAPVAAMAETSAARLGAGVSLESEEFKAGMIKSVMTKFENNTEYAKNSRNVGEALLNLGNVDFWRCKYGEIHSSKRIG